MQPASTRGFGATAVVVLALLVGAQSAQASGRRGPTVAHSASAAVGRVHIFRAPGRVTHLAVHWRGGARAGVRLALSRDGRRFGWSRRVEIDDLSAAHPGRETYGAVIAAPGVRSVRVSARQRLRRLTVLWLDDRGRPVRRSVEAGLASVGYEQPKVIPRIDWGADEAYRFDSSGSEIWPPAFYPVQKLIVHHTATQNNDPDPAATVRSIYYYHAVTQGWGDIGYNFLVDEAGNIYEGRHTFDYASGSSPTEENSAGYGVTAAHVLGYNSGTVGIALLGTLSSQDATAAARDALERLLAWEADHHGIDPQGASLYTNPVNGTEATFPNIAGHRDLAATECPGGALYATLPTIRADIARMLGVAGFSLAVSPSSQSVVRGRAVSYAVAISPFGGFADPVTLSVTGLPPGVLAAFEPNPATSASSLTVTTSTSTRTGGYTLTVTGTSGSLSRSTSAMLQVKRK
jgi:hypothetical protein